MSNPETSNDQYTLSYQDVQQLIQETDQLKANHSVLLQQSDLILQTIDELENSKKTIIEISQHQEGEEVLIPLGTQLLMKFKTVDSSKLIYKIGSNIFKDLSIKEAEDKLNKKIVELKSGIDNLRSQIFQIESMISYRENVLSQINPAAIQK